MLRKLATMLTLTAIGALVAGCGNAKSSSTRMDAQGSSTLVPRARATADARAINLREGDVRGLVAAKRMRRNETGAGPFGRAVESCDGGATRSGEVLGILSQRFERDNARHQGESFSDSLLPIESVHSAVYSLGSASLAARTIAIADSARGRACLKRQLASEDPITVAEGAKVEEPIFSHIEVSPLSQPLRHALTYAVRMTADSTLVGPRAHGTPNYYEDFLGFAAGSTVVTLNTTGSPRPISAATERRLLLLLYGRAKARKP